MKTPRGSSTPSLPSTPADRIHWVVALGVALVAAGLLAVGLAARMYQGALRAPETWYHAVRLGTFLLSVAVGLIGLGVGSCLARRWARTLLVVGSGLWAALGVFSVIVSVVSAPSTFRMLQQGQYAMSREAAVSAVGGGLAFTVLLGIVIPVAFMAFYGRRDVRDTFARRDPSVPWTDRVPLPRLTLVLWQGLGLLATLALVVQSGPLTVFGYFIPSAPATGLLALLAGLWVWAMGETWQGRVRAWWLMVCMCIVGFASSMVTCARLEPADPYRGSGLDPEQIEALVGPDHRFLQYVSTILAFVATCAFLAWVKRFFASVPTDEPPVSG